MALTLLELLLPWRRGRLAEFVAGRGAPHTYLIHVGVGWALARLHRGERDLPSGLDPLLRWLAFDGYGFHEGYFHPGKSFRSMRGPSALTGYACRAFDQGLGRSLWFAAGADPASACDTIARFPEPRRADLWSGIGLAAAYAGGCDETGIGLLGRAAGPYTSHLAQGVAFAAKAREAAGPPAETTELACRVLCRCPSHVAAGWTDEARLGLLAEGDLPDYEVWRQRVRSRFERENPFP